MIGATHLSNSYMNRWNPGVLVTATLKQGREKEMGATYTVFFKGSWSVKTDVGYFSPTVWGGTGAKAKTYFTIY
ncbi:MAG: hypothetical protein A2W85_15705 [Bacteroidetes bacterium GWF2_41_31]|nr:MAG: hypothetical protein A2W85_15705 [Bacteroidetes bacterium GWF2_41_31]